MTLSPRNAPLFLALLLAGAVLAGCDSTGDDPPEYDFEDGSFPTAFEGVWSQEDDTAANYYVFADRSVTLHEVERERDPVCERVAVTELIGRDGDVYQLRNSREQVRATRITTRWEPRLLVLEDPGGQTSVQVLEPVPEPPSFDAYAACPEEE